jgi:sterol desaturase/sphingolipid hydroxylase (fatty acid hydroxylase superfamily)
MAVRRLPWWISAPLALGAAGLLVWLERKRPLRRAVEPTLRREARNVAIAALGAVALQVAERPLVEPLAALVERRRLGLVARLRLPRWLEVVAAIVLLDYSLYVWHVLTHTVPWLWRFHRVHHADLDLTVSTATRFHFGELTISAAWRAAQVLVIGVTPFGLSVWQTYVVVSILFHHSNVRIPERAEALLVRFIVTPRMHGIHHSVVPAETDSNWSSGLTLWDWLHGTLRLDVPQEQITIGVPELRSADQVTLGRSLALPFRELPGA